MPTHFRPAWQAATCMEGIPHASVAVQLYGGLRSWITAVTAAVGRASQWRSTPCHGTALPQRLWLQVEMAPLALPALFSDQWQGLRGGVAATSQTDCQALFAASPAFVLLFCCSSPPHTAVGPLKKRQLVGFTHAAHRMPYTTLAPSALSLPLFLLPHPDAVRAYVWWSVYSSNPGVVVVLKWPIRCAMLL